MLNFSTGAGFGALLVTLLAARLVVGRVAALALCPHDSPAVTRATANAAMRRAVADPEVRPAWVALITDVERRPRRDHR